MRETVRRNSPTTSLNCPYCGRPLQRKSRLLPTYGGFACDLCGDFLDYRRTSRDTLAVGIGLPLDDRGSSIGALGSALHDRSKS